jgi:hypothetical protein
MNELDDLTLIMQGKAVTLPPQMRCGSVTKISSASRWLKSTPKTRALLTAWALTGMT